MSARPPEQDALVSMGHTLNKALSTRSNPEQLGAAVAAKGMLPEGGLADICGTNDSPYRKVMKIMDAVRAYITLSGHRDSRERITQKFNEFILILHDELGLKDEAQQLAEECRKLNPSYISPLSSGATALSATHGPQGNGHDASGGTSNGSTSSTLPSFQEILEHVGISRESLKRTCSEEHILEIAKKVADWEVYAPYLGLGDADVAALQCDHSKTTIRSLKAFRLWEERAAFRATYLHLAENVFFKHGNAKMATSVCKLAK